VAAGGGILWATRRARDIPRVCACRGTPTGESARDGLEVAPRYCEPFLGWHRPKPMNGTYRLRTITGDNSALDYVAYKLAYKSTFPLGNLPRELRWLVLYFTG
jgi:hypothetical protein